MTSAEGGSRENEDGLSPSQVLSWLLKHWLIIVAGALLGVLVAVTYHFATEDRFTARVDFSIPETPVGSPAFIQQVATRFFKERLGESAAVSANPATGVISLVSRNLSASQAASRLVELQEGVSAFRDLLEAQAVARYETLQRDIREYPDNDSVYGLLYHFRTYVNAQDAGIFDQIRMDNIASTREGLPLTNRIMLGLVLGGGLGLLAALAYSMLVQRRRRVKA